MVSRHEPRRVPLRWQKSYRIVASKHPPIDIFADIVTPEQVAIAAYIEGLTNDRLLDEAVTDQVRPQDRLHAPGASIVMAAFTHIGRASRFSDGTYGVYYAAHSLETAVRETAFHRARFMGATNEQPGEVDEWGLVYRSVRHEGGECIAAFRPQAISIPVPGAALAYVWDGERISKVYEKSEVLFEL
jgi:hypothetical protein